MAMMVTDPSDVDPPQLLGDNGGDLDRVGEGHGRCHQSVCCPVAPVAS